MSDPSEKPASDEYVAKYMEGGAALAIAKKRMPAWWFVLLAVPGLGVALAGLSAVLTSGAPMIGLLATMLVSLTMITLMSLLFSHLRTVVTERVLHVQLGLWGPKIPIEKITAIRAAMYDWTRYGGWGIRYGRDGSVCYSVPGGTGQCVEVEWTKDNGKAARHVVSVDDAAAIVAAVERARSASAAGASGVRVDASTAQSDETVEASDGAADTAEASKRSAR
jgi:hypothetical protein